MKISKKRLSGILSVCMALSAAAAAAVIGSVNVYAYSEDVFKELELKPTDGFYTVITDAEGEEHTLDGIIDTESLESSEAAEKIASYMIYRDDEEIISVKLNDIISGEGMSLSEEGVPIVNGYYSVKFTLSDTENTEVFLTGLSPSNIDMVQEQLLSARLENSEFTMESLDFIDTEKTGIPDDGDNELCWAAGASNILHYTGWGQKADFNSADDILDCFRDSFTDLPGNSIYGWDWFFNGIYLPQTFDNWAHVKDYGESGGFLRQYESERVISYLYTVDNYKNMKKAADALEGGSGIVLSVGFMDENANRNGGHSISMWGYICDRNFSVQDKDYYKAVIISDSDSDMGNDENRRMAPNKLRVLNLLPYSKAGYDTWQLDSYYGGIIDMAIMLEPYSDAVKFETDARASLNKFNDADLTVSKIYVSNDDADNSFFINACSVNESIYVLPKFYNTAEADFDGAFDYTITVTDKNDGSEKRRINRTYTGRINGYSELDVSNTEATEIDPLPAGEYTVTVEVNPERSITEAYYYNNTETYDFTVSDKSYDLTQVSFSVQPGEFVNGEAEARLTLDGYDTIDIPQDVQSWLFVSYYDNGKWSTWSKADTPENGSVGGVSLMSVSVPESCLIYALGQKARLRLAVEPTDAAEPLLNIYSDEFDLSYVKVGIAADETNTGTYTPLDRAARSLADGELIAFWLKNASTYDSGELGCSAAVYAKKGGEKVELFRQDVSLAYEAAPITLDFSEWQAENLSGTYEIIAVAEGEYCSEELILGTLYIKEQPSLEVTTASDITNEYDDLISLREAVAYAEETDGEEITFAEGVEIMLMSSPVVIDSHIKIKGRFTEKRGNYIIIHGMGQTQLFKVTENGKLEAEMLNLTSGCSTAYGGAVENCGGIVNLNNCLVLYNKSGVSGGGIYSKGGSVKLSNCALKENKSGYGGAIGTDGNAKLDMLNCSVFGNTSNSGALYNNGGDGVIINSTFTDNTASSSGGGAITSPYGKVSLLGSIAVNNGEKDIDGAVNVYGSYITEASDKTKLDERTVKGSGSRLFECGYNGSVIWRSFIEEPLVTYKPNASELITNGIYLKNSEGKIAYSADNSEWIITEIPSVFTDAEYKTDILGTERGRTLGSVAKVCGDTMISDVYGGNAYIYVPKADDMVLIEKGETYDNIMTDVKLYKAELEPGTNIIELESSGGGGDVKIYMLWDSMENMRPESEVFRSYY